MEVDEHNMLAVKNEFIEAYKNEQVPETERLAQEAKQTESY